MNFTLTGVTSDSREVKPGGVFVAVRGAQQDGHDFLKIAEEAGAVLLLGEKEIVPNQVNIPYIQVADGRLALSHLASAFHGNPSLGMKMIGVTGTSGKTTTTYLLESILQAAGFQVGVVGTVNFRYGTRVYPSTHTTPAPMELHSLLSEMKKDGCTAVVMEVSSHALKQKRVSSIAFDAIVFTNLSPEHLDFHPDMEDYYQSKAHLFKGLAEFSRAKGKKPVGVVNAEDTYGQRLLSELKSECKDSSNFQGFQAGSELQVFPEGIVGHLEGSLGGISIQSQLTGHFNCQNIAAAVSVSRALGISDSAITEGVKKLTGVPGRLERVSNSRGVHAWVDYAHKPDALAKVLKTLKTLKGQNRLITVVGCGGDRDRKKRPWMGQIAVEESDFVYITSDNPRTEDPQAIIQEILQGVGTHTNFAVDVDRRKAIFDAVRSAQPGDLILIAGKGHEDYQILGTKKVSFDDRKVVAEAFLSNSIGKA